MLFTNTYFSFVSDWLEKAKYPLGKGNQYCIPNERKSGSGECNKKGAGEPRQLSKLPRCPNLHRAKLHCRRLGVQPLGPRRKLTLWNGRRSDCLARMATCEGLTRGPHPAAHRRPRPCSTEFNGVQRGRLILLLPGHFVYSISARFHVEHFR